jgi:hypothetical protein
MKPESGFHTCRPIGDMSITRNLMSILKPPKGGFAFGVKGFAPCSLTFKWGLPRLKVE